jgi:hypothetical protein
MIYALIGVNGFVYICENILFYFRKPAIIYPIFLCKRGLTSRQDLHFDCRRLVGRQKNIDLLYAALWGHQTSPFS